MQRVSEQGSALARHMKLSKKVTEILEKVALVHDVNDIKYESLEQKLALQKQAKALLKKYVGKETNVTPAEVMDCLALYDNTFTKRDNTTNIFERLVDIILINEELNFHKNETLRKVLLVEASHETFAMKVLKRNGIVLSQFEKWLIYNHYHFVDLKQSENITAIENCAAQLNVPQREIVIALSILIMTDVFENYTNKQRLTYFKGAKQKHCNKQLILLVVRGKWLICFILMM